MTYECGCSDDFNVLCESHYLDFMGRDVYFETPENEELDV